MSDLFGIGYGATFGVGDGASPEVFTALASVISISPPSHSKTDIEVTTLQSTSGYREYILGLKESGEVNVKVRATYANLGIINTEFAKAVDTNYQIISNTELASTWDFTGRFLSVSPGELNNDGTLEVDVTVKVTGPSVLTASA